MKNNEKRRAMSAMAQLLFNVDYNFTRLIHNIKDCENCKYFGGLMCDHVDAEGHCLGWERYHPHYLKNIRYKMKIKKLARKMRKDPSFKYFKVKK